MKRLVLAMLATLLAVTPAEPQAPANTLTLEVVSSSNQASVPLQKITLTQAPIRPVFSGALGKDAVSVIFEINGDVSLYGNGWPMVVGSGNNPIVFTTRFKTLYADSNIVCHVY